MKRLCDRCAEVHVDSDEGNRAFLASWEQDEIICDECLEKEEGTE